jgi:7-cyano-7-deazaguanine synthase in queuosine biosynthesis
MSNKKTVLVLFSGGIDSTYLVHDNLSKGNTVIPAYIEIKNNFSKIRLEKIVTKRLVNKFRELEYPGELRNLVKHSIGVDISNEIGFGFAQLPAWIFGLMYSINDYIDEVQIGYVMGDEIISYLDDIKKLYNSFAPLHTGKLPKLTFPLIKKHKENMFNEFPEEILELIMYCECPEYENRKYYKCGECKPCRMYKHIHDLDDTKIGSKVIKER